MVHGASYYIVWNEAKSEGYVTKDKQLAYEVRKGSDSNCYTEEGDCCDVAIAFCEKWADGTCTIQEVYYVE